MLITILQVLVTFQAATPVPPAELHRLGQLLKVTETMPAAESGEIDFHIIETTPKGRKIAEYRYRYAIDGEQMFVVRGGIDEEGRSRAIVTCRNDRYEFELEQFPNGWALQRFVPASGRASNSHFATYYPMALHGDMYALQRRQHTLSALLADSSYRLAAIRVGSRNYLVHATGADRARPGLRHWIQDFQCNIQVVPSGRYAYVQSATSTCLEDRNQRQDVALITNEVAEDPDRPRLVRSSSDRVVTVNGETYRYETTKRYRVRSGIAEEEKAEFEISHYGLSEPTEIDWVDMPGAAQSQPTNWTPLYLAVAFLVGLAAVYLGRRLVASHSSQPPSGTGNKA
jgi:hypothetical protein